jgi:hypothetical protein
VGSSFTGGSFTVSEIPGIAEYTSVKISSCPLKCYTLTGFISGTILPEKRKKPATINSLTAFVFS